MKYWDEKFYWTYQCSIHWPNDCIGPDSMTHWIIEKSVLQMWDFSKYLTKYLGFTDVGLFKISDSLRVYTYLILSSQASARASIIGNTASALTLLVGVELHLRVVVTILECCVTFSGVKLSLRSFVLLAQSAFLNNFEDIVNREVDIREYMKRYQDTLSYVSSKVDYSVGESIFMLPSDMKLKIRSGTLDYNNKILISDEKFILGKK